MNKIFIFLVSLCIFSFIAADNVEITAFSNYSSDSISSSSTGTGWGYKSTIDGIKYVSKVQFDNAGRIYVNDEANRRLMIYDQNFSFLKKLNLYSPTSLPSGQDFLILSTGVFVTYTKNWIGFYKSSGKLIKSYYLGSSGKKTETEFVKFLEAIYEINTKKIWSEGDYVILYDNYGKGFAFDSEGNLLKPEDKTQLVERWINANVFAGISSKAREQLTGFVKNNDLFLAGNRLYFSDDTKLADYIKLIRTIAKGKTKFEKSPLDLGYSVFYDLIDKETFFLQFDAHDNMYFLANKKGQTGKDKTVIVIMNMRGDFMGILDFRAAYTQKSIPALLDFTISPRGNLYKIVRNGTSYYTKYNINNSWDAVSIEELMPRSAPDFTHFTMINVTKISSSGYPSENFDIYKYHPIKVFDSSLLTAWVEDKPYEGIGSWVEVTLEEPVSITELKLFPGYFGKGEWWSSNNRIKSAKIVLDNKQEFVVNFEDVMSGQTYKFDEVQTFQTFKIIVLSAYVATGQVWNDTALGEVEFYNDGFKYDIDISNFNQYMEIIKK